MSVDEIRELRRATPFRPFTLVTARGERISIANPLDIALPPKGTHVIVSGAHGSRLLGISEIKSIRTLRRRKLRSCRGNLPSSGGTDSVATVNIEEIRELYSAGPFEPFELVLTNGTQLLIDHPEFMSFSRDHRTVHVQDRDGRTKRVDVKLIVALNEMANGARPRKRKR